MANDYAKFNVEIEEGVTDCRAFYQDEIGIWHRVGADEYNNVSKNLTVEDVENFNFDYAKLKTEKEMNENL